MFALVDVNNFYVSCHRAFNPQLKDKPVVVLSNNDGCCVARSKEVKALGVKMAAPWFQLHNLVENYNIIAFSSNYALYGGLSKRFMRILLDFSPRLEVYSIDECFLDLEGFNSDELVSYGQQIRCRVLQWLGLPVCVGIAPSKTLAKLANHIAKKCENYQGVLNYSGLNQQQQNELLASVGINEIWGIGRQLALRLNQLNIKTAKDLRDTEPRFLRSLFSVVLEKTVLELRGISCLELEELTTPKKEIISSRSFGKLLMSYKDLKEALASYTSRAAEKLRSQNSVAEGIQVFLYTNSNKTKQLQFNPSVVVPLIPSTNDTSVLIAAADAGLRQIYRSGVSYKKAGVMLIGLRDANVTQEDLFLTSPSKKSKQLMVVLDDINQTIGRGTLRFAAEGYKKTWKVKANYPSPRYTTSWDELPIAYAR